MPYIKDVLIDVIEDVKMSESSTTTDHAVEDGSQITDHVKANPITIQLKGLILDKGNDGSINDSEGRVATLRKYREEGEIIDFDYMTALTHCVITNFDRDYAASTKDGFAFTMTLKQIKTVKVSRYVAVKLPVKKQTKAVTNKGRQQPKKTQKAAAKTTQQKYKTPNTVGQAGLDKSKYMTPTLGQAALDRTKYNRSNNYGLAGLEGRK